jgi:pimeloyl-ACP methyl ester carboxylesterase
MKGLIGELSPEREKKREMIGMLASIPSSDVFITSHDGLKLHGEYFEGEADRPIAIGFHGYRSSALRDLAGLATYYYYRSFDVLLVDERAHGESEGRCITFGAKERLDVLSWVKYAEERFGKNKKIILFGMSMGAASVLLSTELDLGDGVVSVVADCPFSSAEGIIAKVCRDKGIPPKIFFPAIKFGARLFGGFKLSERDPIDAVRNAKVPILLIHGTADDFVPREMSDELSNVGRNITYLNIEGAPHLMSMMYDEEAYTAALDNFHK